jgi:3-deoxy-manno-octulosonate cytidylyltransferase (CMP-KDO synthetase)
MRNLSRPNRTDNHTVGLIPARWTSSRFDGKPLALIDGVPMIKRTYDQVAKCKQLDTIVVLTDDERINDYCSKNEMRCVMIVEDVRSGTDRCAKALELLDGNVFVNIQGDEPLINPDAIDSLIENHTGGVSNAYVDIDDDYKLHDKNVVKVAIGTPQLLKTYALHYSRLPISNKQQLGLYAFDRDMLEMFPNLPVGENEKSESVEMLRYVENGLKVRMTKVKDEGLSVDTIEDLRRVEEYIKNV